MSANHENFIIKPENFVDAISHKQNFSIQFHRMNKEVERELIIMTTRLLGNSDRLYLRDPIMTIIKELITNAVKANVKRLYFQERKLNIADQEEYRSGMEDFKNECLYENSPIFEKLMASELRVLVYFKMTTEFPEIMVMNTSSIRPEELQKINARIKKAYKYADITEAFGDVLDDSEGAGLGLIMALMVFKNSGFSKQDFSIASKDNKTVFTVRLSENAGKQLLKDSIADEITNVIEYIPSFKENILMLIELCDKDDSTIQEISSYIKTDPGLSSSILKQANSAGYLTSHRVSSIEEAVKKIGLSGIKTLAMATGVDNVIQDHFPHFKEEWEVSYKKAFYANKIAIQEKNPKVSETAYLAGLISNIGKIALMSANQEVMDKILKLTGVKDMHQTDLLEEITLGISHASLSATITENWHFYDELTEAIRFHTRPFLAPNEIRELVYTVYMAHILIEYENKSVRFHSMDPDVLSFFNIQTEEELIHLNEILNKAFHGDVDEKD